MKSWGERLSSKEISGETWDERLKNRPQSINKNDNGINIIELKPCPFCGGEPTFKEENDISIECFSCGVSTISLSVEKGANDIKSVKNTLTKLWNRRTK